MFFIRIVLQTLITNYSLVKHLGDEEYGVNAITNAQIWITI